MIKKGNEANKKVLASLESDGTNLKGLLTDAVKGQTTEKALAESDCPCGDSASHA